MPHCDIPLNVNIGKEGSLIVYPERKDAVLVWQSEGRAEGGTVGTLRNWDEVETMKRRKHCELKL